MKRQLLPFTLAVLFALTATGADAAPLRQLQGLDSVTFFERTISSGPRPFTFAADSSQMTTRRSDPLTFSNRDFCGVCSGEFYDVFYSDADGTFDVDGEFITVEAVWNRGLPSGGGLNLAEVRLNFADGTNLFADRVSAFRALGNNAFPETANRAADGDLLTHTTLGNTIGLSTRLSVTVGFTPLTEILVAVDIKPTSCPNPVNSRARGRLPVAILGTVDFDVADVDPVSVTLLGVAPRRSSLEDVASIFEPFVGKESELDCVEGGRDGFVDLTLKFDRQEIIDAIRLALGRDPERGEVLALPLTGQLSETAGGTPIRGEDVVVVVR